MNLLEGLNEQQREAVLTTDGPVLILAGAGSGKDACHHRQNGLPHRRKKVSRRTTFLAVTFTNKAAAEMRDRVEKILKGQRLSSAPLVTTFHSLCVRILRQDIEALGEGYKKSFTIYDTDDQIKVIKACIKEIGFDEKQLAPRQCQNAISSSKNRGEDVEMFTSRIEHTGRETRRDGEKSSGCTRNVSVMRTRSISTTC